MCRLNDSFVKTVTPPEKGDAFYYDDDQPGFALRVYPSGAKKWAYVAKVHGKVVRRVIGDVALYTAQAARGIAREVAGELRQGHDRYAELKRKVDEDKARAAEKLRAALVPRIDAAALTYIEKAKIKQSTKDFYTELLDRELDAYRNVRLTDIDADLVEKVYAEVSEKHSPIQATKAVNFLRTLCYANRMDNPIPKGFKMTKPKPRQARLDPSQGVDVWKRLQNVADKHARAFLGLQLLTGCRSIELHQLTHKDVDLVGGYMTLVDTKNHENHKVYLSPAAEECLRLVMIKGHPDNKVFRRRFEVRDVLDTSAGRFSNHDFRKCFAITCIELGIHEYVMKAALNHKDTNNVTYTHYAHATPSQLRDCWNRVAGYLTGESK